MASGGVRYDFTGDDHAFTQHENRTMRIPIYDADGVAITDFSGWEFACYFFTALKDNRAAIGTDAVISKTTADGEIDSSIVPNVDIAIVPADTAGLRSRTYWYECYRVDSGNQSRLAYGEWELID